MVFQIGLPKTGDPGVGVNPQPDPTGGNAKEFQSCDLHAWLLLGLLVEEHRRQHLIDRRVAVGQGDGRCCSDQGVEFFVGE